LEQQGIDGKIILKYEIASENSAQYAFVLICGGKSCDCVLFFRCTGSIPANQTSLHGNIC